MYHLLQYTFLLLPHSLAGGTVQYALHMSPYVLSKSQAGEYSILLVPPALDMSCILS